MTFVEVQPEHRKQNQQKAKAKKKKKQKITQSYDFTKRTPSSWGATSQYFRRSNLTLYEPNTNTHSNPTQPIQNNLIKLFSHNSLITPDKESEREGKRTL